ncbi:MULTISPECIES: hypothetical protein [unclassified Caballeronia]|uniref:hypothetical protein n=1 Tax=unclassified Caballeronia TaxID=2646786 RepID=UPI0015886B1E|nr:MULTISPECIES: hypothetical protein [unclassified Caballeronia]QSN62954.1 hypothetical protein JYK05_17600 [Caballeronia sp. M1242]
MFVTALLLCPVGVAALFAFALYADKVFRRGSRQKPAPIRFEPTQRPVSDH